MATVTQKERLASLESALEAHDREHELIERVWVGKLDAIEVRLRDIEDMLQEWRVPLLSGRISKRDVGVFGGSAALVSLLWYAFNALDLLTQGA